MSTFMCPCGCAFAQKAVHIVMTPTTTLSPVSRARFHHLADDSREEAAIRARAAVPKRNPKSCWSACCTCLPGVAAPLVGAVRAGSVAVLRGSWLVALKERGGILERRHNLPSEAFWTASELERRAAQLGPSSCSLLFVALVCPWLSAHHADPQGKALAVVASTAKLYLGRSGYHSRPPAAKSPLAAAFLGAGLDDAEADFALLWPFASLHQEPQKVYEEGRRACFAWLRHTQVATWLLHDGSDALRGWAFAELSLSALTKTGRGATLLDLSRRTETCMRKAYDGVEWDDQDSLARVCSTRLPPRSPAAIHRALHDVDGEAAVTDGEAAVTEAEAANPADESLMAELYREAFETEAASLTSLDFGGARFEKLELALLLESLPALRSLKTLSLSGMNLDEAAAAAVAGCLLSQPRSPLEKLDLSANSFGPEGGQALAPAIAHLASSGSLTVLDVSSNYLKDEGAFAIVDALQNSGNRLCELSCNTNEIRASGAASLARLCVATRSLKTLSLSDNLIKDEGAVGMATILKEYWHGLRSLSVARNGIGRLGAAALEECRLDMLNLGVLINVHRGLQF